MGVVGVDSFAGKEVPPPPGVTAEGVLDPPVPPVLLLPVERVRSLEMCKKGRELLWLYTSTRTKITPSGGDLLE